MSIQIQRGLFKFDFTDNHAILGVPVDANPDDIRQRYKLIARRLHPDSCKAESKAEKELASQLFSKFVSPAYAQLSKERTRTEYLVTLRGMGKRLASEAAKIQLSTESAKQLSSAGANIDIAYKNAIANQAKTQYETIDKIADAIAQISEINMVYLMKKEGQGVVKTTQPGATTATTATGGVKTPSSGTSQPAATPAPAPATSRVEPNCRRAAEYLEKNNVAKAVLELRDAVQQEPNNSRAHGLLGMAYLRQNQATMAKIHINKALQVNPQEPDALKAKEILDKAMGRAAGGAGGKATTSAAKTPPGKTPPGKPPSGKPDDKQGGGGLFGGMFGGKKK